MRRLIVVPLLLGLALLVALGTSLPVGAARTPPRASSPEYGLSAFLYNRPATTARDLALVQDLQFGWVKALFRWDDIEHNYKGAYDWTESDRVVRAARAAGLKIIARLDFQPWWARADTVRNGPPDNPQDFADFVYAFVQRYSEQSSIGRVEAIQIWNEPNLAREWGDRPIDAASAADYVRLLGLAYRAAKGADPSVTVISAGLSPTGVADPSCCLPDDQYLMAMYTAGLKGKFDALGANANVQCPCVGDAPGSVPGFEHPSFYFRRVEQLRDLMVANGDADKQVWLMEFGWSTNRRDPAHAWYATTEERKGELIVEAFQFARQSWAPWIGVMALWTLPDPTWSLEDDNPWDDEQLFWSITEPDGRHRPSYERLLIARRTQELR